MEFFPHFLKNGNVCLVLSVHWDFRPALIRMKDFLKEIHVCTKYLPTSFSTDCFFVKKTKHVLRFDWIKNVHIFKNTLSKLKKRSRGFKGFEFASDIEFNKSHGKFLMSFFCSTTTPTGK